MSETKLLSGECQHCGGHLEFPADDAGCATECTHCGKQTDLLISGGATQLPNAPMKTIVFIVLACVILIGGLVGAVTALNRAKRLAAERHAPATTATNTAPANPFAAQQFSVSGVTLEKTPGTSVFRAVGSVKNLAAKRRFAVRVEIEVKDENGTILNPAKDYTGSIEPGAEWDFKAMILSRNAAAARVTAITEQR